MQTPTQENNNATASKADRAVVCDALVGILKHAEQIAEHGIPYYAFGDNEAACELAMRLRQVGDEIRCAIALAEDRAVRNANQ